jgi:hypothetical protein
MAIREARSEGEEQDSGGFAGGGDAEWGDD